MTIAEIEDAIISRLQAQGIDLRMEIKEGAAGIPINRIEVFTNAGRLDKISQNTFKQTVTVSLLLFFRNIRTEKDRRRGLYPILEGIIGILLLQTLELSISPVLPKAFRNVTTEEDRTAGELVYLVELETSYTITKTSDEQVTDLLLMGLNYFLKPGDDVSDASDNVVLGV